MTAQTPVSPSVPVACGCVVQVLGGSAGWQVETGNVLHRIPRLRSGGQQGRTSVTSIRVPRIAGRPCTTSGSIEMRSSSDMVTGRRGLVIALSTRRAAAWTARVVSSVPVQSGARGRRHPWASRGRPRPRCAASPRRRGKASVSSSSVEVCSTVSAGVSSGSVVSGICWTSGSVMVCSAGDVRRRRRPGQQAAS